MTDEVPFKSSKMKTNPLVSIVLTSYNQPELLDVAFQSLISQTYRNIEIIIVDDCSVNPLNKQLILKYKACYPDLVSYVLHSQNVGIAKNKNSGFKIAKGDLITYLDGDDFYFPEKIEAEVDLFNKRPELDVVYANFMFTKASGEFTTAWANVVMPEGQIFKEIVKEEFPGRILYRCELVKRVVYEKNNFYDDDIKIYHDWDFRIRYAENTSVGYCNKILSVYRRTDESITIRSSLSNIVDERLSVITKNKMLLETSPELKDYYKSFKKQVIMAKLFDSKVSFPKHMILCLKAVLYNPLSVITILKSIVHSQLYKVNNTALL